MLALEDDISLLFPRAAAQTSWLAPKPSERATSAPSGSLASAQFLMEGQIRLLAQDFRLPNFWLVFVRFGAKSFSEVCRIQRRG